jgi:predicted PurR-regulated permease PerM
MNRAFTDPVRLSYVMMVAMLLLVGWLKLTALLLTVLFCYFALRKLSFSVSRWLGFGLFVLLIGGLGYGLFHFAMLAYKEVPEIAAESIPTVLGYAEKQGLQLPFTDYASLKKLLLDEVKEKLANAGLYARTALFEVVSVIIGLVVAVSLFFNAKLEHGDAARTTEDNMYAATFRELILRFRTFYRSFATVMGAQILISAINTLFTAVFLVWNHFPYATVIIGLTFLFGLLPILGNLLSNTLIVSVGFTISPQMAGVSLLFLMAIHKFEYFLNSKIIGHRIKNPMWLTLIGLVVGERLMGIPGMILAPVILHFLKVEASRAKLVAGANGDTQIFARPADSQ